MSYEQEVRVLGGLPLLTTYEWRRAEPDVGIFSPFPEDISLFDKRGRPATWAEKRMTKQGWEDLEIQIQENHYDGY